MEREHGSLILAALRQARQARSAERNASGARYGLFVTLADGMDTLPRTLAAALPPGTVRTGDGRASDQPARPGLPLAGRAARRPADRGRRRGPGDRGPRLGPPDRRLRPRPGPAAPRRSPMPRRSIVNVAYRRDQVAHPLDGFGAVVPAIEGRSILAVSFLSVKFPEPRPGRHGPDAGLRRRGDPARPLRPATTTRSRTSSAASWPTCSAPRASRSWSRSAATPGPCRSTRSATSTGSPRSAAGRPAPAGWSWPATPSTASASPTASARASTPPTPRWPPWPTRPPRPRA